MPTNRGYLGVNRNIKQQFRGLSGINREISLQYRGLSGVNRKVFSPIITWGGGYSGSYQAVTANGKSGSPFDSTVSLQTDRTFTFDAGLPISMTYSVTQSQSGVFIASGVYFGAGYVPLGLGSGTYTGTTSQMIDQYIALSVTANHNSPLSATATLTVTALTIGNMKII